MADSDTALTKAGAAQLDVIANAIMGKGDLPAAADPEAMSAAIMQRILEADTFEDAFTQQNLTPWRSMLNVPVLVRDVHFNRSTIEGGEGGAPVYAVCDLVIVETGEAVTVTCGGKNVLAQLVKGLRHGWLADNPVQLIANKTRDNFDALWLEAV